VSTSPAIVEDSERHSHVVQFYEHDHRLLIRNVGDYLAEGLRRREALVVIATPEHSQAIRQVLESQGADPAGAVREGRMVFRDAEETLAQFMVHGKPDWKRFDMSVGAIVRQLRAQAGVRAYGEMVDLLWNAGHSAAANLLEQFWNKLLASNGFSLFCAYQIDVFGKEFQMGVLDDVLSTHTHVVSAGTHSDLEASLNHALNAVLGGSMAEDVKLLMKPNFRPSWATIPQAETSILWIRNNLPDYADEILSRARRLFNDRAATPAERRQ